MDYNKLTADLIKAKEAAEEAAKGEDGGTCNYDCLCLRLSKAREAKVREVLRATGLSGSKNRWYGPCYLINPPSCGQGDSRLRAMEAMAKVMKDAGWDAMGYYQMD